MQSPDTETKDFSDWLRDSSFRTIKAEQDEGLEDSKESGEPEEAEEAEETETPKRLDKTGLRRIKREGSGAPRKINNIKTRKIKTEREQEDVKIAIKTEAPQMPSAMSVPGGSLAEDSTPRPKLQGIDAKKYIRMPTVFDAVAGRVGRGLPPLYDFSKIPEAEVADQLKKMSRNNRVISPFTKPLTADEVLFEDSKAPRRYEEYDIYFANERELPHGGQGVLPESDALKAIHEYGSLFYRKPEDPFLNPAIADKMRSGSYKSMDETALIAFGILMEESARDLLGRKGHEAFVVNENSNSEKEDTVVVESSAATPSPRMTSPAVKTEVKSEIGTKVEAGDVVDMAQIRSWKEAAGPSGSSRKKAKKRKVGGLQSLGSQDKRLTKGFKSR